MMRSHTSLIALAGGVLLAGLSAAACTGRPSRSTADDTRPPVAVRTAAVVATDLEETFETGGLVQARTTATVMSRIPAPVAAVHVAPGDRVRRGQVLVELDSRDLTARARSTTAAIGGAEQHVVAADAEIRAAEAGLRLARTTHDRIASLHTKRSATRQELDEAVASLQAAEARAFAAAARAQQASASVATARAEDDAATTIESFTRITAPFDGVVTEKMVEPGNMATPGMPLLRVEDTRSFRLDVRVDQSRVGAVPIGARVPMVIDLGTKDGDRPALEGSVAEVARAVDSDTRAFLVKIDLPVTANLRSGLFGRARFATGTRRALVVPPEAVVRRGQVASTFVVSDGVARLRLVDVAGGEVLAGLVDGDRVVVSPSPDLADGMRVAEGGRQ